MFKLIVLSLILFQTVAFSSNKLYVGAVNGKGISIEIEMSDSENYNFMDGNISGNYIFHNMQTMQYFMAKMKENAFHFDVHDEDDSSKIGTFEGKISEKSIIGNYRTKNESMKIELISAPWNDGEITCIELHQDKDIIFTHSLDLGSGLNSPIGVDYECNGTIATLPFMNSMLSIRNEVRGHLSWSCFGSIQELIYRSDRFSLLKAGISPELFIKEVNGKYWFNNGELSHDQIIHTMQNYFKLWGHQNLNNYELYRRFWDEYIKTLPKLTKYYQETFHIPRELATTYATAVMHHIFAHAVGSFPHDFMDGHPDITPLEKAIISTKTTPHQFQNALTQATADELNQGLKTAILHNKPIEYLQKLLDAGANIDSGHESALFYALKNPEIALYLISKKANVNYTNSFGKTPLFYAIGYNDLAMVELLLSNGAKVNQRYFSKEQLQKAEYQENTKLPFYLNGVSCSLTTTLRTPLLHAAQNTDVAMMKTLIANGASINDTDENGDTLADYAERSNKKENIDFVQSLGIAKKVY